MERTQFTFYESFYRAAQRIKNKAHRCQFYDIVAEYALNGIEPNVDSLPDSVAIAFELSKPNLDASRKKAKSGKKGGSAKQSESKTEANPKQTASKKKKEIENEIEIEIENEGEDECPPKSPAVAVVVDAFLNKINSTPSQNCLEELTGFIQSMGQDCCLRAIDIALDERKTSWSYIKAILSSKRAQGVKCLADWDRLEEKRQKGETRPHGAIRDQASAGSGTPSEKRWNIQTNQLD